MTHPKKTIKEAALEIFHLEKRPMHYKELSKKILKIYAFSGKTPHESVRSLIGTDKRFKRIAEGIYALTEWDEYPVARFAKDIAYDVLLNFGNPLHVDVLGNEILNERTFVGTPRVIARNATRSDPRFTDNPETKTIGLTEWDK